MCGLKKNMGFQMRSSFWCCSFRCERCTAFFVLVTSDLGLEAQKWELLVSAVFRGDERIPSSGHGPCLPPANPEHPVHKLLISSFIGVCHLCKNSDKFSGVVLLYPLSVFAFQMRFDLLSKTSVFPRMGENTARLGWTSAISGGPWFGMGRGLGKQ